MRDSFDAKYLQHGNRLDDAEATISWLVPLAKRVTDQDLNKVNKQDFEEL